tara:strand:- start:1470 stop:1814 length:345 start_codon:yes stop_codon:yes gene_type:complete
MPAENRVYPSNIDEQENVAATVNSVAKADLVREQHYGKETPGGVDAPHLFEDYTPIWRIDDPSDGINDDKDFVVYFEKDDVDPKEFYKATNSEFSSLTQLTTGTEYDLAVTKQT